MKIVRRLWAPFVALVFFAVLAVVNRDLLLFELEEAADRTTVVLAYALQIAIWLSVALFIDRIITVLVWEGLVPKTIGTAPPKLLVQLSSVVVYLIAFTGIVGIVFDQPVTGIWATSGILGLVLGLDFFSGIALNVESPFKVGDWIVVHNRDLGGTGQHIGCVREINWRTTRMKTRERNVLIVPNSVLSTSSVTNLSMPNSVGRFEISLSLDASIPTDRALRVVEAGVRAAIDERMGLLEEPKPSVKIADTNDIGVEYEIKYYIDASRISPSWARHAVFGSVLDALRQAGLGLAYPKEDVFHAEMPRRQFDSLTEEGKVELLSRQTLFESLRSDELSELARRMHERLFRAGDEIIILGEEGDTMYILVEGLLHVYIDLKGDGDLVRVAHVRPGTFFGEMSLLTGEPRSGTLRAATDVVVYEIDREAVEVLFQKRPEIGEILSHAVAEHRLRDKLARTKMSVEERQIETRNAAQKILGQMKAFFRGVVG